LASKAREFREHWADEMDGAAMYRALADRADGEQRENFLELADFLAHRGVTRVVVVGLALDYCVQATALDARAAGYEVVVLTDATRAVNVKPDDGERALDGLRAAGVREDRAGG
jgi:nicotinamidase/pyrazinamidase